ncbi:hypothetical protein BGZ54_002304, partial [Gamsiella multidivaricata]
MSMHDTTTSKELSRKLFFLAAYSLTGAALMGSSIGLVVYQSGQFFFLNRPSHLELFHPRFPPSAPADPSPYHPFPHTAHGAVPPPPHPHHHHDHHHHHRHPLKSIFSTWLPVAAWLASLLISSTLITSRKWVPRILSARAGILISQSIFMLFWVLLGAIQEVQERLVAQRWAMKDMDAIAEAMDGTNQADVAFEMRTQIRAMIVPLCTLWYAAVVLLGTGTGLLTASSSCMENQLKRAYRYAQLQKLEQDEKETEWMEKKEGQDEVLLAVPVTSSSSEAMSRPRYTNSQRAILMLLILGLFTSQMKLFQWIVEAQSVRAYYTGTTKSVSTCLTFVGLVS